MAKTKVSSTDVAIGARMRSLRLAAELSQEELGQKLGISFQQVQKYELGRNRISASRLLEIANVLGVSTDYFYDGLNHATAGQPARGQPARDLLSYASKAEGMSVLRAFAGTENPVVRRRLLALASAIAAGND